jgi:GPH family glycoside/pentoside/hexuronide:cation symporter
VFLKPDATHPVGQLNPEGYKTYAVVAAATILFAILISALGTHRHIPRLRVPPVRRLTLGTLAKEMVSTLAHRSFLVLAGAALFNAMAHGLVLSMSLYLGTFFWQLSSGQIAILAAANFLSAILALLLAAPISKAPGKRNAARITKGLSLLLAVAPITLHMLGAFPGKGDPLLLPLLFAFTTLATAMTIITSILVSSMVADVVESSELRTGRRSEGLFFAFNAFVAKVVSGVGIFTSSAILALIAFPRSAAPGAVDPEVVDRLGLSYVAMVAILYGAAILCISLYRITREDHDAALRELAAARAATPGE